MNIRDLVRKELDTAYFENGCTELATMPPEEVCIDLLTCSSAVEHIADDEIMPYVKEWQKDQVNKA